MRKFLTIAIPIVSLALFIAIMLSGPILKRPFGKKDDASQMIETMIEDVNNDSWGDVANKIENLDKAWEKIIHRIQFSSERVEINSLSTNIARLRGAVLAKDKVNSLMELEEALDHFEQIGK